MYDPEEACNEEGGETNAEEKSEIKTEDVEMVEEEKQEVEVKEEPKTPVTTSTPRQTKAKRGRK